MHHQQSKEFEMNEYYVWDTEAEAQAALDYINSTEWFPVVGKNVATGKPEPEKQQTTVWASEILERVDGKWCFARIPEGRMDALEVSAEDRQAFLDTFNPTIEEYQDGWFEVPARR
jgi:hypothetical protein